MQQHSGGIVQVKHAQMHNELTPIHTLARTHTHTVYHYPVVGVDFGHRSVQRVCCFEAVVSVNATEGIS